MRRSRGLADTFGWLVLHIAVAGVTLGGVATRPAEAQQPPTFSISPRFYMTWIESSEFYEPVDLPLWGLTLSVAPLSNWGCTCVKRYSPNTPMFFVIM